MGDNINRLIFALGIILTGIIVYGALLVLFKTFSPREISFLRGIVS